MNYMKQVAKMLGVELNEKFIIQGFDSDSFVITQRGLCDDGGYSECSHTLSCLLNGTHRLIKKPWKPNNGERYCYVGFKTINYSDIWRNYAVDLVRYKIGNCFKTKEEITPQRMEKYKQWLYNDERINIFEE